METNGSALHLNLDPLQMDTVVAKILSFLPFSDLKNAREACRLWRIEGGKHLLLNHLFKPEATPLLDIKRRKKEVEQVKSFLSMAGSSSKILNIKTCSSPSFRLEYLNLIPEMAGRIKKLHFRTPAELFHLQLCSFVSASDQLMKIVGELPSLKILQTDSDIFPDFILPDVSEENVAMSSNSNQILSKQKEMKKKMEDFMNKLEGLDELYLHLNLQCEKFQTFSAHHQRFRNLKKFGLELGERKVKEMMETFLYGGAVPSIRWNITHLSITINRGLDVTLTRNFLQSISTSLTHLKIIINWIRPSPSYANYVCRDVDDEAQLLHIPGPETLEKLKEITIVRTSWYEQQFGSIWWKYFLFCIKLVNVKKVVLGFLPTDLESRLLNLKSNLKSKVYHNESVEEIQVQGLLSQSQFLSFIVSVSDIFRMVKSLKIEVPHLPTLPKTTFSYMKNLHLLNLTLNVEEQEEWLTGIKRPQNYLGGKFEVMEKPPGIFLRDLSNLKHLTIQGATRKLEIDTADFLIFSSLRFMTNLQSLQLHNFGVSAQSLQFLKKKLGPHTAIIVDKRKIQPFFIPKTK